MLKNYSQEEIEELATQQLLDKKLKIVKINKEYKKHNRKTVSKAILNGSIVLICACIVLNSNPNISNFGTEAMKDMLTDISQFTNFFPKTMPFDILAACYVKAFEGLNYIIDKFGMMGVFLASQSIRFILSTVSDTIKTLRIKKELLALKRISENNKTSNHIK